MLGVAHIIGRHGLWESTLVQMNAIVYLADLLLSVGLDCKSKNTVTVVPSHLSTERLKAVDCGCKIILKVIQATRLSRCKRS